MSASVSNDFPIPDISSFESIFIRTILEHRGVGFRPTASDFHFAADLLSRFEAQRQDNPAGEGMWEPALDVQTMTALRATAFLMFGATKPTPAQWQKAMGAHFGPLLCETCG